MAEQCGARATAQLAGKYMTFELDREEYGLQIMKVREIIGLMDITRVPRAEPHLRGVINLRGKVIPVIDLRLKFGLPAVEPTDQTVIIVVQYLSGQQDTTMGVLVDEVLEVLDIPAAQIEPTPDFGSASIDSDFLLGVGKTSRRVIFLLDICRVLGRGPGAELLELSRAGAPAPSEGSAPGLE